MILLPTESDISTNSEIKNSNSKTSIKDKNLSKTSHNTTLETSFKHRVPDDTNMFVKTVEFGNKKDFCIYCKTEQTKLSRHLNRKHKDIKAVKNIFDIPKGCSERKTLIKQIRKNGQYAFNTNSNINSGELKVMRRPAAKYNKKAQDFAMFPMQEYLFKISHSTSL